MKHLKQFAPDHFDYIIVDEFHHASAATYKKLLAYFQPQFLLGLTATPERSDQADILSLCDNNLIFERNLVYGIEQKILAPFDYFGIADKYVDYQKIPWRSGKFDPDSLDTAFATTLRADHILEHWQEKRQTRTLAFCTSKKHADFMASYFKRNGISAAAVHSDSNLRRNEALDMLRREELGIIFSVDLFNEGIDLPEIDTILMIRPTESKILFLQQLGRGLRQSKDTNKSKLVVIDFIGNHVSFLHKPAALLNAKNPRDIVRKIEQGFSLAENCFINYDPELLDFWEDLSRKYHSNVKSDYKELTYRLNHRPTATEFLHFGYDISKVRSQYGSWFEFVAEQEAEQEKELPALLETHGDFLREIEVTNMTRCFKAILLAAFLELDGFSTPPSTQSLAARSRVILSRLPDLEERDLGEKIRAYNPEDWHKYWLKNPIKAFTTPNKDSKEWFILAGDRFQANFDVKNKQLEALQQYLQELVDLLLAKYTSREEKPKHSEVETEQGKILPFTSEVGTLVPFYPDLKIACGHFKTSSHERSESEESIKVPHRYGKLDPQRHFVAPASGNSMNGGKNAIQDGDLLILEWITPMSAGSISNRTMAIEMQDEWGNNQYLLRIVRKQADGSYQLEAQNPAPEYQNIPATDSMNTFARLRGVLRLK